MSELITPEEFINDKEFIKALKTINANLADLLKTFNALSTSVKGYYTEVNKGAKSNADLVKNQNLVAKSTKELTVAEKELERLRKDTEKTLAKQATLKSQEYKDNVKAREELKKQKAAIHDVDGAEAKRRGNIGKYKEDIVKAYVAIKGVIMAASGAMTLVKGIIASTNIGADKLAFAIGGLKESFSFLGRSISNLNFTNLISGFREAYREGKRYAEALGDIDDLQGALGLQRKDIETQIFQQRIIAKNQRNDLKTREAAVKEIIRLETLKLTETQKLNARILDNALTHAESITKVDRNLIVDYIKNSDKYTDALGEIAEKEKEMVKNATTMVATRSGIYGEIFDIQKYNEQVSKLTKEEQKLLEIYKLDKKLTGTKDQGVRGEITKALGEEIDATNELLAAKEGLARLENRLYNELIKKEEKSENDVEKIEEEESKKTLARFEYTWKQKEKIQEDSLKQQWAAAEEALKVEYAGREVELADFKDKEKQKAQAVEEAEKQKQAAIEETKMLQIDASNAVFDLGQAFISREASELDYKRDKDIKAAGDNAKKKEKIEADYQKKMAAIKRKAAIIDKVQALFNIGVNTAIGVTKATAQLGAFGLPVVTWIKILGALQAAAVLAAPIPKFFKGVKDFKGGPAIVGEKGMELVETRKGEMFLTPDKATQMLLPEHSTVHTHEKTIEKLKEMDISKVNELIKEQRLTRKALGKQVHNSTIITKDGARFLTQYGNSTTEWINKNFR